jgi:hypothetical protein
MLMADLFSRYQEKEPVPLMVWALLKHILAPEFLDNLFERAAVKQRQGKLLFSSIVRVMSAVVTRTHKSPREALKQSDETVSEQAFYKKLNGIEPDVCQALVRESAERMSKVIDALGAAPPPAVPGYRMLILDGNAIGATDHRLEPLQDIGSAALPGKSLNILDGQRGIVLEMIPCEDGHAQERSMSDEILERVCVNDLLIADRNFCTTKILYGIVERGAAFLIREHKKLPWTALEPPAPVGVNENGSFWEHRVRIDAADGSSIIARRIIVELPQITRDGDHKLVLLTTLPIECGDALFIAEQYRSRWTIETFFKTLTTTLRCEVSALGYPKAALFVFAVALISANVFAAIRAAIRSVHGAEAEAKVSTYYLAGDVPRCRTFVDGVGADIVAPHARMSLADLLVVLQVCARHIKLSRYPKTPPKPKRPRQKKRPPAPPKEPHISTAKILVASRKKRSS